MILKWVAETDFVIADLLLFQSFYNDIKGVDGPLSHLLLVAFVVGLKCFRFCFKIFLCVLPTCHVQLLIDIPETDSITNTYPQ
jgi:hypothetical protein